jgi:hypothetical protein
MAFTLTGYICQASAARAGRGLVARGRRRGVHRKRRERRPLPGMLPHIDASRISGFRMNAGTT